MLIDSDQQERRTLSSAITDNHIGQDFLIGMPDVWRRVRIVDCRSNEVFHLIELTLKFHNKIAKVTNPNFTTRLRSPRRQNNSQQGRKEGITTKERTRKAHLFGRPLLIPHPNFKADLKYLANCSFFLCGLCGLAVNYFLGVTFAIWLGQRHSLVSRTIFPPQERILALPLAASASLI
jgi:hypothetical protein